MDEDTRYLHCHINRQTEEGRWVAKLVAYLLATAALWDRIQTSLKKYKMGNICKGVANTI
jgi:hypothetical protein